MTIIVFFIILLLISINNFRLFCYYCLLILPPQTKTLAPPLTVRMVQKCSMALDHWFLVAQPVGSQATPQSISQQTTPPASQQ